jgi:hypothetical protein
VVNRILERTPFAQGSLEFAKQNVNFLPAGMACRGGAGILKTDRAFLRG